MQQQRKISRRGLLGSLIAAPLAAVGIKLAPKPMTFRGTPIIWIDHLGPAVEGICLDGVPRFGNYTSSYTTTSRVEIVDKMRTALAETEFHGPKSPPPELLEITEMRSRLARLFRERREVLDDLLESIDIV